MVSGFWEQIEQMTTDYLFGIISCGAIREQQALLADLGSGWNKELELSAYGYPIIGRNVENLCGAGRLFQKGQNLMGRFLSIFSLATLPANIGRNSTDDPDHIVFFVYKCGELFF
jgi:hypothetical protein